MNWQTTYPTVGTVMEASFETLQTWDEHLPDPNTDVQRTVRSRIVRQMKVLAIAEMRKVNPEFADKYEATMQKAIDLLKRIGANAK